MTNDQKLEALRCASTIAMLTSNTWIEDDLHVEAEAAALHIMRLCSRIAELEAQLAAIGAGGVGAQRITQKG